jgi:hypothetical protein
MEWHQTHGNHVFDTIPLQPFPRAHGPQLRCHRPPVLQRTPKKCYSKQTRQIIADHCLLDIFSKSFRLWLQLFFSGFLTKCLPLVSVILAVVMSIMIRNDLFSLCLNLLNGGQHSFTQFYCFSHQLFSTKSITQIVQFFPPKPCSTCPFNNSPYLLPLRYCCRFEGIG